VGRLLEWRNGKMKFEIKNRWSGEILFAVEAESFRFAVEIAVKSGVNLFEANLYGANLYGANLSGANLSWVNLSGANLSWVNLSGAGLYGANLYGANLYGANLSGARGVNKNLCTPLTILLDQPGKIRAYKLVTQEGYGPYYQEINYLKGKTFSVEKYDESDNPCGSGISLATLDWCMREWNAGYRILVMEFTAGDIVSIPFATDGKFRVKKCKRVGEKDLKEIGLVNE
jgi:hypothetical protein